MPASAQSPQIDRAIALYLEMLRKDYPIEEVRLFGSRARGDARPESDVDLAVVLRGERGNKWELVQAFADISFNVLMETGVAISSYPLWSGDLDYPKRAINPALIRNIQREGVRL